MQAPQEEIYFIPTCQMRDYDQKGKDPIEKAINFLPQDDFLNHMQNMQAPWNIYSILLFVLTCDSV